MTSLLEMRAAARVTSAGDHAGTIRAFYPYWDAQYRPYLLAALDRFPAAQLDYKPRSELLTARQVFVHIAEAERAWIHAVIDGHAEEEWVVPADDPAQGWRLIGDPPNAAALQALLAAWHLPTQRWLARGSD